MYHYRECGLRNIWLKNGYEVVHDEEYGKCVSFNDIDGLQKAISLDLVNNKPRLTGAEYRFLRKELDLSQAALSDLLGNDEQAVARWEKTGKVPKWADRLMRLFVEDHYGNPTGVRKLIERVRNLDIAKQEKRFFEDSGNQWKVAA
jgi:DNA-binding transcriptional regulator YiaG